MRRVVIAPDSFKGTLSSAEVCRTVSKAIKENYPDTEILSLPVADGGEGTAEAFYTVLGGSRHYLEVRSPLGRSIRAYFIMLPDKTAVIESALASGLTLEKKNDALLASSYGTGQLIKAALDTGAERLLIGIGGSAMTDAGTGCLAALGAVFTDENGMALTPCGESLEKIKGIDLSGLDERIKKAEITVLCDVKNPLYGKNGAAYVYAFQKGASEKEVGQLDRGLRSFSLLCAEMLGVDFSSYEGAGAAGGLGFALVAFLSARLKAGAETVLDLYGFDSLTENAAAVITGEGRIDRQSLMGKLVSVVASRSKGKKLIVLAGTSEVTEAQSRVLGIDKIIETNPERLPFEEVKENAEVMLYKAAEKISLDF